MSKSDDGQERPRTAENDHRTFLRLDGKFNDISTRGVPGLFGFELMDFLHFSGGVLSGVFRYGLDQGFSSRRVCIGTRVTRSGV